MELISSIYHFILLSLIFIFLGCSNNINTHHFQHQQFIYTIESEDTLAFWIKYDSMIILAKKIDSLSINTINSVNQFPVRNTVFEGIDKTIKISEYRYLKDRNLPNIALNNVIYFLENGYILNLYNSFDNPRNKIEKWNWSSHIIRDKKIIASTKTINGINRRVIFNPKSKDFENKVINYLESIISIEEYH